MPKKTAAPVQGRNPFQKFKWFEYVEEDDDDDAEPYRIRVRTNLTFGEQESLVWDSDTTNEELWELFAPYVVDWNILTQNEDGEIIKATPPAEGGPEQFRHIPVELFRALMRDIKMRSTGPLARRSPNKSGSTDAGTGDSSTTESA